MQDYVPMHDGVALKLSWEMEQLGHSTMLDIARWPKHLQKLTPDIVVENFFLSIFCL